MTTTISQTRVMPASEYEVTPEPPLAEDVQVWRSGTTGRCWLAIRTAGIGVRVELAPHQADAVTAALLDITPAPYDLPMELDPVLNPVPAPEVWVADPYPGGYVCAMPDPAHPDGICREPVESEPCPLHGCPECGAALVPDGSAGTVRVCPSAGAEHYEVDLAPGPDRQLSPAAVLRRQRAYAGGGW